jgi:hypothetical protein
VRRSSVHPLLVPFPGGAVDLPEDVAAEQTHLVFELAQADVARIVFGAERRDRADVLRSTRGRVRENLHRATSIARPLCGSSRVSGVHDDVRRGDRVVRQSPRDVATSLAHGVEELTVARATPSGAIEGHHAKFVDGHARLIGKRFHGAALLARRIPRVRARGAACHTETDEDESERLHSLRWYSTTLPQRAPLGGADPSRGVERATPPRRLLRERGRAR